MSEESKNLGDKAKDAFEDAKEKASELKDDAKEAFEDVKEEAKETYEEIKEDVKELSSDGKTIAIIAHLTLIGWIVAFVMNNNNKTEVGSFYIRQVLGIIIISVLSIIPILGIFVGLFALVLWVVSLIGALSGNTKPVFLLGDKFQEWFKSL
ncbi:MAG: YtxH domain-containing protein [Flavobacteriaceae bacterium]|jgi:uncharacterized membrane protein YcjF (UPF0283 family)|nr:YtxH domain-containing protein [Flavobacteriaceae bacterium]